MANRDITEGRGSATAGVGFAIAVDYVITGKASLATLIAFWETIVKVGVYYWHERVWDRTSWGRRI